MKVFIYVNEIKDGNGVYAEKLKTMLNKHGIEFAVLNDGEIVKGAGYSAIFVIGGDGTILRRTEFSNKHSIPIIGINSGKLGFLTEFELSEMEDAVLAFKNGELVRDERATLKIGFNGNTYYALNDLTLSRVYDENQRMTVSVGVKIDDVELKSVIGDGVIVSSPTGSTGYSLSSGGAILAPGINAFCVTPIAAHSFLSRSVVFSADSACTLTHCGGSSAGIFADGKMIATVGAGAKVSVERAEKPTVFLRRAGFDFFRRINEKLKNR